MKVVAVSGVDGSGKTTFVSGLTKLLADQYGLNAQALWLRFNPRASYSERPSPLVSTLDAAHQGHVAKRVARRLGLRQLWIEAVTRLYRRQLKLQLASAQHVDVLIADRFVLDFAADLIAGGLLHESSATPLLSKLPAADASIVLTASPVILLGRKHVREDGAAILRQREIYSRLAELSNSMVVDTTDADSMSTVLARLADAGVIQQ